MGVINVSPDSFYPESRITSTDGAVKRALEFEKLGADIVDIGGESTRPGSEPLDADDEINRVIPVIEGINKRSGVTISIDTYKPEVAKEAIACGATMVNDISGLSFNNGLEFVVAQSQVHIVLMHIRGKPSDMQSYAVYDDVVREVSNELDTSIRKALDAGIEKEKIILDPGIGFAKEAHHSITLIKNLPLLKSKGYPILIGLSRKSFIGAYTGLESEQRLIPTVAANAISIFLGADIIRVHDVHEAAQTVKIVNEIKNC
ncbi:MAG: dihydropteroate synthase [Spirochaetota bacterium]|nr:MAG: dihydropteroate synthase [Spirochaetota bacterium]